MAKKSTTQMIALLAIGGFVLYEVMKNQSAATSTNPLGTLAGDVSGLFGGSNAQLGNAPALGFNPYGAGAASIYGPGGL